MTDKEKLNKAIALIKTLKKDAKMALNGSWDRTDGGFEDQITLIDRFLDSLEDKEQPSKFTQTKLPL